MKPLPETLQQRFDELYTEYMSLRSKFHKIQFEFKKYRKGHKECDLQHVVIDALREENYALREQIKQMRESK